VGHHPDWHEKRAKAETASEEHAQLIDRLFREHNDSLLQFLAARLGSRQEAKEVAQEAYVRLLNLDTPGAVSYLRAFLFRTAGNLAIDRLRTRGYRERRASLEFFDDLPSVPTPEREVGGMQEVQLLLGLIAALPPRARYAFIQNKFHGVDVDTIAKDMGITTRMVRAHIVRALVHCRAGLDATSGAKVKEGDHGKE
jgi:RNA polymerase sigma-70 factor (ECF subfamily)